MSTRALLCCAVLLAFTSSGLAAEKKPLPKKVVKKAVVKNSGVKKEATKKAPVTKAVITRPVTTMSGGATNMVTSSPAPVAAPVKLTGKREELTCREGTEDRHARIGVVTVGGKVESFAYYSKWKPRTCSIYFQRGRDSSKWLDKGSVTNVSTDKGTVLIEEEKGAYRFVFRDVERERYCGMDGYINGTLTVKRGSEACILGGDIMVEGTPLGEAHMYAAASGGAASASNGSAVVAESFSVAAVSNGETGRWRLFDWFRRVSAAAPVEEAAPRVAAFPTPTAGPID